MHVEHEPLGHRDLVVIGAGPVGVAALWYARRHGIGAVGVDAAASPLDSLRGFTAGLVTTSSASEWEIDGLPVDCCSETEVTREDLLSYYARVASYGALDLACRQRVTAITPGTGDVRIDVQTERGPGYWVAKHVIVTPWYRRRVLDLGDEPATGVTVHRSIGGAIPIGEEVVVVGAGISGLEGCDALIRAGARVTLLSRSKRALPPELATLFEASGSRYIEAVTGLAAVSRAVLAVEHDGKTTRLPCSVAFDCTGHEINGDLLRILHEARVLSDAELLALRPFPDRASLLDKRELVAIAAQLPPLADAIWTGRRGVRFAGTLFHVGGVFGAGILYSIETAKWAVEAIAGVTATDAPAEDAHLPSLFLARKDDPTFPGREGRWSDHLAAIVPVPVPTWSRGTKLFEGERATGVQGRVVSRDTRALGEASSASLTALREACYQGLSVGQLAESLDIDREDLVWGLRTLCFNNGLTWIPPAPGHAGAR